jgi:iron complex outermembrane receptor protein
MPKIITATASLSVLALMMASGSAFAQSAGQASDTYDDNADIIVTAQRKAERLQDVPIAIVAQTGEQLAKAGVVNIRELASVTPGLTYSTTGAWSQPSLRGISSTGTNPGAESPVAIYVDGVYQPSQTSQIFDLPDIERIEVLKGPQGTLFGRNATAGAIQIFSKDPTFDTSGKIAATAGLIGGGRSKNAEHIGVSGYVSTGLVPDVLAAGVSGYYDHSGGYFRDIARGGKAYGKVDSMLIRGKLLFQPASNVKFTASAYYAKRKDRATESASTPGLFTAAVGVAGAIIPTKAWTVAWDSPPPYYEAKTVGMSLRGQIDFAGVGTLTTTTGYTDAKAHMDVDVDGAFVSITPAARLAACPGCTSYFVDQNSKSFTQEVNFSSEQFGIFQVTAGATYFHDKTSQPANANSGGFFFDHRVKTDSLGLYAEVTATPVENLTVIGGLRYSHEKAKATGSVFGTEVGNYANIKDSAYTPRASVRYALSPKTNLFFTFSKGFKTGVTQAPYCFPSPAFDCSPASPEKLTAFEGGIKSGSRELQLNASLFHYRYSDLQLLVFSGLGSFTQNAATASITGVDIDATVLVSEGLHIRGAVSWMPRAKFTRFPNAAVFFEPLPTMDASGTRLLRAPKLTATAGIDYEMVTSSGATISANANLSYSSSYRWEVTGKFQTKGYATLGARASYQPANSPLKFSIYGKNLTNSDYTQGTLLSGSAYLGFYAPPREIGLQAEVTF